MRVLGNPQISTDAWRSYPDLMAFHFPYADYGTVEKKYDHPQEAEAARRYSPSRIRSMTRKVVQGDPQWDKISTSYVERSNLTLRMQMRRFTRLTNGFSKSFPHLQAAVSLYVGWYNWCRVHETLRVTPAMESGLTDHVWSLAELLDVALYRCPTPPPAPNVPVGPFMSAARAKGEPRGTRRPVLRVIKGGRGVA